jgi:hypothetical protein
MKNPSKSATPSPDRARELRTELVRKIASFIGPREKLDFHRPRLAVEPADRPYRTGLSDLRAKSGRGESE